MKRFLSILLVAVVCLSALASCAAEKGSEGGFSSSGSDSASSRDTNGIDGSDSSSSLDNSSNSNDSSNSSNSNDSSDSETDGGNSSESDSAKEEAKPLTKFEKQFSVENETRLAKILAKKMETTDPASYIPSLSLSPKKRMPAGDNAMTYVYEGATLTHYNECCDKLYETNFAQYTETEFNGTAHNSSNAVKNYFTTYLSLTTQIDIELHAAVGRMYVTATPRTASVLPAREMPEYKKPNGDFPVIFTFYGLEDIDSSESSLGYIIRIADGSFIVIDGGEWFGDNSKNNAVAKRIYDILKKQAPDPNNIVISAWIITHAHNDHAGAFYNFQVSYDKDTSIKIKQMVHNFPDKTLLKSGDYNYQLSVIDSAQKFVHKPETLKPHTGNVLYYPGMTINVLYTQENYLAVGTDFTGNYNCSSLVLQLVTDDGTKIFIGADHPVSGTYEGTKWCEGAIYNWYGSFIESDVVSTFHHGYGGGADTTVYYVIKAKLVLMACDKARNNASNVAGMAHNKYFGDMANRPSGVSYYLSRDSVVGILKFSNGEASFGGYYENITNYLNS